MNAEATAPVWCLELFHEAASAVPAYAAFLEQNGLSPVDVAGPRDFERIPVVTKRSYLLAHQLRDLLWKGSFEDARIISTSSGSSGSPFYWPRGDRSHREAVHLNESIFRHFDTRSRSTLCVNAFAMGTYIAAVYELLAVVSLAQSGHQLTTVSPGIEIDDSVRILRDLAPQFSQTVILGYPPLVHDIVEAASREHVLDGLSLRFVFAGENYSEHWRERLHERAGIDRPFDGSLGIYGTADAGIIGIESPLTVYIRKLAASHPEVKDTLFPEAESLPTLVETDPAMRYVEETDGDILFTAWNTLPLIRYRIGDQGRVLTLEQVTRSLDSVGHQLPAAMLQSSTGHFVALYGRADVAATFYSVNIYPENVKAGLEGATIENRVSGKFVLSVRETDQGQQSLHLDVELASSALPTSELESVVADSVLAALLRDNGEFRRLEQSLGSSCRPRVELVPHGDDRFRIAIKHRWTSPS